MHAHPWRIPDDDVEPAGVRDVGEMRGEREGKCRAGNQRAFACANRSDVRA